MSEQSSTSKGNPHFHELLEEQWQTHLVKAAGYSGTDEPDTWANFREAEAWGIRPLDGVFVRLGDKYRRVQNLRRNPANDQISGESLRDTLMDLANYAMIGVCLLEEEWAEDRPQGPSQFVVTRSRLPPPPTERD